MKASATRVEGYSLAMLGDMIDALKSWSKWKRMSEAAERMPELERRIATLEEMLGENWPGDVCRSCGARALRLEHTHADADAGTVYQVWQCRECSQEEQRVTRA